MYYLDAIKGYILAPRNYLREIIWAKTWDDTKHGIDWAENMPSISPGRWAGGYNYLYVMTRVLNEMNPHKVLDFGLGISSTLISKYFEGRDYSDGEHLVIEQDEKWKEFYLNSHKLSNYSRISIHKCIEKKHRRTKYNAYSDLDNSLKNKKFEVISIDAPKGSYKYSRRDIIDYLPEILDKNWVIAIDDAQMSGEKRTVRDIEKVLNKNGIRYCKRIYKGASYLAIITSEEYGFFCSM